VPSLRISEVSGREDLEQYGAAVPSLQEKLMARLELTGAHGAPLNVEARHRPVTAGQRQAQPVLLHGLLWASALLNIILCFIDTNLFRVSQTLVIAGEAVILAAAVALPFTDSDRRPGRWDLLLLMLLVNWVILSLLRGVADPKFYRDVAIIPIFILAGIACRGDKLHSSIFRLHLVILAFAIWEAASITSFTSIFNVSNYFLHTRSLPTDDWWIDNGLFLSSVRPDARFLFPDLPIHRLSSIFLEPVSLGNYVVIATLWLVGFWRHMPRKMVIVAAIANVLLLIGCDSRLATVACLILLVAAPFKKYLSSTVAVLTAPAVIAATFLAVALLHLRPGTDDFAGRLAYGVATLQGFGIEDFTGISIGQIEKTGDAGFAYLINSQSLLMAMLLWTLVFARRLVTPESRYIHFAVALYLSLNLIVSWSLFSIKTASLLWFLLGRAIALDRDAGAAAASGEPPSNKRRTLSASKSSVAGAAGMTRARYRR
jgi:putative polymerase